MPGQSAANCGGASDRDSMGASWLGIEEYKAGCGDDNVDELGVSAREGITAGWKSSVLRNIGVIEMKPNPGLMLFAAMAAIGSVDSGERGSRGYRPQAASHWDEKREAKAAKKQQRQNKKRNRR
jgi:hypothetical protein